MVNKGKRKGAAERESDAGADGKKKRGKDASRPFDSSIIVKDALGAIFAQGPRFTDKITDGRGLVKRRRNLRQENGPTNKRPKREETKSNETRAASTTSDTQGNKQTKPRRKREE
jgi:hypothetical protein